MIICNESEKEIVEDQNRRVPGRGPDVSVTSTTDPEKEPLGVLLGVALGSSAFFVQGAICTFLYMFLYGFVTNS